MPDLQQKQMATNPKKNKPVEEGRSEVTPKPKKTVRAKAPAVAGKKTAPRKAAAKKRKGVSDDDIRVRAYLIAERRSHLSLPGSEADDWFEARRQLLAEAGA
jgi:hypothetical protein